jgi:sugar (pentulose or hexulose) kinase
MTLIGIDIGTTHVKAGLFLDDGEISSFASRENTTRRSISGYLYYDPEEIYQSVCSVISEISYGCDPNSIAAIGIASMAETGLLMDKETGDQRCPLLPWFDANAASKIRRISLSTAPDKGFKKTGIRVSFKCALAKLLWLQDQGVNITEETIWLGVADYVAYRLTGCVKTDFSLAGRSYAFRIDEKVWDENILSNYGLSGSLFPEAMPSGSVVGTLQEQRIGDVGLPYGIPVCIAGHDHVCAAFGVRMMMGDSSSEFIVDSVGTAEALMGSIDERILGDQEYESGFSFGCDAKPGRLYWMGGLSASGGSVEWIRQLIGDSALTYRSMENMLEEAGEKPTGITYFPYLSGSGSPHSNGNLRAAFIGLNKTHSRADLLKAVLEGTAYEMEFIRRRAEDSLGVNVSKIAVVGGGTRNRHWMHVKADIYGCSLEIPAISEATLLGAALLAGVGSGFYQSIRDLRDKTLLVNWKTIYPDEKRHEVYSDFFESRFLRFQESLREITQIDSRNK